MDEWLKGLLKEVQLLADTNAVKTAFQTKDWTSLMEEYLPPRLKERPDYEMFFLLPTQMEPVPIPLGLFQI